MSKEKAGPVRRANILRNNIDERGKVLKSRKKSGINLNKLPKEQRRVVLEQRKELQTELNTISKNLHNKVENRVASVFMSIMGLAFGADAEGFIITISPYLEKSPLLLSQGLVGLLGAGALVMSEITRRSLEKEIIKSKVRLNEIDSKKFEFEESKWPELEYEKEGKENIVYKLEE